MTAPAYDLLIPSSTDEDWEERILDAMPEGLQVRVVDEFSVPRGAKERIIKEYDIQVIVHDCDAHSVPYISDGALGHGFECGICGKFLQAG